MQVEADLALYITTKVRELSSSKRYTNDLRLVVVETMAKRAEGTFLWVSFVTKQLSKRKNFEVEDTLKEFPPGLDGIYSRMLLKIDCSRRANAALILRWVILAFRQLSLLELCALTGVRPSPGQSPEDAMKEQIAYCGDMLTVNSGMVQFVHASALDYLFRTAPDPNPVLEMFRIKRGTAHAEIARRCFQENLLCFSETPRAALIRTTGEEQGVGHVNTSTTLASYLGDYAAIFWLEHARLADQLGESVFDLRHEFFHSQSTTRSSWLSYYWRRRSMTHSYYLFNIKDVPDDASQLHFAAYFGILPLAQELLTNRSHKKFQAHVNINKPDAQDRTPLFHAAAEGHARLVQMLIEKGANIKLKDKYGHTALTIAVTESQEAAAKLLLKNGASPDDSAPGRPLLISKAAAGDERMVRLLLEFNADVEQRDTKGTPLISAASEGHQTVVKLLLDWNADPEARDARENTVLHVAAENGHIGVVRQILSDTRSKLINARNEIGRTPLHLAASRSHLEIFVMLLEAGADVHLVDKNLWTLLHCAVSAQSARSYLVDLIIRSGVDVSARNNLGETALHIAGRNRPQDVIQALLDANAPMSCDDSGATPLHAAARNAHLVMVQLLLLTGCVDINHRDKNRNTALNLAAGSHGRAVSRVLLQHHSDHKLHAAAAEGNIEGSGGLAEILSTGVDASTPGRRGQAPLYDAAACGQVQAINYLLVRGASIADVDCEGRSALHIATLRGHHDSMRVLLQQGAPVDDPDYCALGPLDTAAVKGDVTAAELLLSYGARATRQGSSLRDLAFSKRLPLHRAAEGNYAHLVRTLAQRYKTTIVTGDWLAGSTPLHLAAAKGGKETVQVLLDLKCPVDIKDTEWCYTPLIQSAQEGHRDVAEYLLSRGADINATGVDGRTSLHWAAWNGHEAVVELLLERGAKHSKKDTFKLWEPLQYAIAYNRNCVVEVFTRKLGSEEVERIRGLTQVNTESSHPLANESLLNQLSQDLKLGPEQSIWAILDEARTAYNKGKLANSMEPTPSISDSPSAEGPAVGSLLLPKADASPSPNRRRFGLSSLFRRNNK